MDKRTSAFGGGLGSLLSRPKTEEATFVSRQRRLMPFWHVAATSHYVYERNRDYTVPASSPEVRAVTVHDQKHELDQRAGVQPAFRLPVLEHVSTSNRTSRVPGGSIAVKLAKAAIDSKTK